VILCTPWDGELTEAEATGLPYAPLCDWSMFLRNPVQGNRTTREAVSDFLRDNIVFGDSLVNLIKGAFYEDAFMVSSEELETEAPVSGVELLGSALLSRAPVMRPAMGFDLIGAEAGMQAGSWYEVDGAPGIYASVMQPGMIAQSVFDIRRGPTGSTAWKTGRMSTSSPSTWTNSTSVMNSAPIIRISAGLRARPTGTARRGPTGFPAPIRWF
jgi:hypothetical protein